MKRRVWRILQTASILVALGIFAQVNAQPVVVKEIPNNSRDFFKAYDYVFFRAGDVLWVTDGTTAGTAALRNGITQIDSPLEFSDDIFFLSNNNRELWKSNGTSGGTNLLKTSVGSDIVIVGRTSSYLFFRASDASTGEELYRTDGSTGSTELVRDINPGAGSSTPSAGASVGNDLFFFANDGAHGFELWKSDGDVAMLIKDVNPGAANGFPIDAIIPPHAVSSYSNLFFFSGITPAAGTEPWVSDGTAAGTVLLKDLVPGSGSHRAISFRIQHDGFVYLQADAGPYGELEPDKLWKTSGTPASTVKVSDLLPDDTFTNFYRIYNDQVHFPTWQDNTRTYLWKTNGTSGGTSTYFNEHFEGNLIFFEPVNDYLLFYGDVQGSPSSFYRTDGTTAGTQPFAEFKSKGFLKYPRDATKVGDYVFYGDHDGLAEEGVPNSEGDYFHLVQADGFKAQSMRTMFGINTVGTNNITEYNGKVIFTTHDDQGEDAGANPMRLWIYQPIEAPNDSATFTLIHAGTDKDVRRLTDGAEVVNFGHDPLNVRYNPIGTPGSVVFELNDVKVRTETAPPYSLAGDVNSDYARWAYSATPGTYKLTATPYSGSGGTGTPGESLTVTFTIKLERDEEPEPQECQASGTILREYWDNVSGNNVSSIPVNTTPTSTSQLTIFEGPTNVDTNYGARIRGYLCPPTTGSYTFWIASNDHSELWLSTDDNPANKMRIAYVTGATNPRQWDKFTSQKSGAITLTAGKRYFIEALHKQGVGTDNIAVGWQLPGGAMERPIPGNRLLPAEVAGNSNPQVYIVDPGNTYNFSSPADVAISASATDPDGSIALVEFFIGSDKIGEDRDVREEQYFDYRWMDVGPGTYTLTAKATDNEGATSVSEPVTFQVTYYPCNTSGTITRDYWLNVSGDRVSDVPDGSWVAYTEEITSFEGPTNFGDNYATRIRGYICVPETGGYKFWIASNDHSELRLSTDDDPANKVRIAWVTGATNPRQWDKFSSQVSNTIMLQQGQLYYIEAVHKEAVGTDHIAVGWQLPDGTMERPIPGSRLLHDFRNQRAAQTETSDAGKTTQYSQINIYPNPVQSGDSELTISGYEMVEEPVETDIQIMNMTGEVVFAERIQCGGNCSTYLMNVNKQLVPGVYLVNMKTNGIRNSRRLLVK